MQLCSLVSELNQVGAPSLNSVNLKGLRLGNPHDLNEVQGRIAEELVRGWLESLDGAFVTAIDAPNYTLEVQRHDLFLVNGNGHATIDFLYRRGGTTYAVEVKSWGLNGVRDKIPFIMGAGNRMYGSNFGGLVIAFPQVGQKRQDARDLESTFEGVYCLDLGYTRKALNAKRDAFSAAFNS